MEIDGKFIPSLKPFAPYRGSKGKPAIFPLSGRYLDALSEFLAEPLEPTCALSFVSFPGETLSENKEMPDETAFSFDDTTGRERQQWPQ